MGADWGRWGRPVVPHRTPPYPIPIVAHQSSSLYKGKVAPQARSGGVVGEVWERVREGRGEEKLLLDSPLFVCFFFLFSFFHFAHLFEFSLNSGNKYASFLFDFVKIRKFGCRVFFCKNVKNGSVNQKGGEKKNQHHPRG